jgi:hypothetical protein
MSNTLHTATRLDAAMRSRRLALEGRAAGDDPRDEGAAAVTMEVDGMKGISVRPGTCVREAMRAARANLAQRSACPVRVSRML